VGVNDFTDTDERELEILRVTEEADATQRDRLRELRSRRNASLVEKSLQALHDAADREENVIPPMLDCAREYCTLYEIRHAMERVYGAYREPVFF
jgi:methylmalonyl-CoA mutase N-terminal domain/subunit